jgi:hypothetical protein
MYVIHISIYIYGPVYLACLSSSVCIATTGTFPWMPGSFWFCLSGTTFPKSLTTHASWAHFRSGPWALTHMYACPPGIHIYICNPYIHIYIYGPVYLACLSSSVCIATTGTFPWMPGSFWFCLSGTTFPKSLTTHASWAHFR